MRLPITLLLALFPFAALAQTPASVADCERIENALAYNECLASFGPKVGERQPRVAVGGGEYQARPADRRGRGGRTIRGRSGRQAASFEIRRGRAAVKSRPARAPRSRRR